MTRASGWKADPLARLLLVSALLLPLACATVQREQAEHRQGMMLRAGFQKKPVETEAQHSQVAALPVRKLVHVPYQDGYRYVYGDLDGCRCLLVGTETAYRRFFDDLVQEYALKGRNDAAIGSAVSAEDLNLYQETARESILDSQSDATLDWTAWQAPG
jgi:hypothetical protein